MAKKKNKTAAYILGSLAVAAGAIILYPKILDKGVEFLSNKQHSKPVSDEDDWGPEIVKKEKDVEGEHTDGNL